MNDDMLSQDEIDALLKSTEDTEESEPAKPVESTNPFIDDYFSPLEQDALGEIGNISFGSSATTLSALLNQKVEITTPILSMVSSENVVNEFPHPHVGIEVQYTEGFKGANLFVIKSSDASIIADLMLGGDGSSPFEELNDIHISAVQEAMNQMMGTAATSMSTIFTKRVDISPPSVNGLSAVEKETEFLKISFRLSIGNLIDSTIMQLLPVSFAKELVNQLLNFSEPKKESEPEITEQPAYKMASASEQVKNDQKEAGHSAATEHRPAQNIQTAQFSSFTSAETVENEQRNLDMLLDIPLKVTVELGRTKRSVKEILELTSGSIIELDKLAGEPVDIHVNDKLIAKGEVVVIEENFGVRVTDILSQTARLKKLN